MTDATAPTKEVQSRVQAIEGIEHSLANATPQSTEAAGALSKMQQELTAENSTKGSNPDIAAQVAKQLKSDGFSNVSVDKTGDLIFSQPKQVAGQSGGQKASDGTVASAPARTTEESDFVNFAGMLSKVQSGQKVEAKDFTSVFGAQDAAILQSMGLQDVSNTNGHYQADFSQAGSINFGSDKLEFQKTASFDLKTSSAGTVLSGVQGLKGTDGSLNPTVTKISISPEDPKTKEWKVDVTGKEAFLSGNQTFEIKDA
jgi:hypothetical protein